MAAIAGCFLCVSAMGASSDAPPTDRDGSVIDTFQVMCNLKLPNFADLDARATAMRMSVELDRSDPSTGGTVVRHKAWAGDLTTGPFGFLIDEMNGTKGTATSCAIVADVPDPDAFRTALIRTMGLSGDAQPQTVGGARSFEWEHVSGPGTTLVLRDTTSAGKSIVMIKLISMQKR
jgi:hypothetical protein